MFYLSVLSLQQSTTFNVVDDLQTKVFSFRRVGLAHDRPKNKPPFQDPFYWGDENYLLTFL